MSDEITEAQRFELYAEQLNELWVEQWVIPMGLVMQALLDRISAANAADAQALAADLGRLAASCPPVAGRSFVQTMAERSAVWARGESPDAGDEGDPQAELRKRLMH